MLLVFFYRIFATAGLVMNSSVFRGGFTLVELMVTIVIAGIIAAVAVPKIFGQIAKAKASELYTAVGTYIHLQDTYNSQYIDSIGSWITIGYTMRSNDNFKYYEGNSEGGSTTSTAYSVDEGETAAWKANNVRKLNDCEVDNVWQLNISKSPTNACNIVYRVIISDGACEVLTHNFALLDTYNKIVDAP